MNTEIVTTGGGELMTAGARLDQNPAAVYLAGMRPASRRTMLVALDRIADILYPGRWPTPIRPAQPIDGANQQERRWYAEALKAYRAEYEGYKLRALQVPWGELRYANTKAIRAKLDSDYGLAAGNGGLSALRCVLKEAWRLGQMTADEYQRAIDIEKIKGSTEPAGRAITDGELSALMQACERDVSAAGIRDAAMIGLWFTVGPRRQELVNLDLVDFNPADGMIKIRAGKGRKDRHGWLKNGALVAMQDWLSIRGGDPGPLFWPCRKGGHLVKNTRMSTQACWTILEARRLEAGIAEPITPHDMRRTFCTNILLKTGDLGIAQALMGHASPATTSRYDKRGDEEREAAVATLFVPYTSIKDRMNKGK